MYPLEGKQILRPFYPGGDYEHAEYPADGVVVDNPPFSIFTKICRFYIEHSIPFFLFGPALTIFSCCKYGATAVVINSHIEFHNGAKVPCNFASNLFGNVLALSSPRLEELIKECPSQNVVVALPKYDYPDNLLSVSDLQTLAHGGVEFIVERESCAHIRNLAAMPKGKSLFGVHYLLSSAKAKAKAEAYADADATSTSNSSANNDNQSNATNNIGPITVHTPINIYVTCGCCGKKHKCRIDGMNGDCDEEDEEED
nr:MAG TPA: adenine-specific methyltransferase [Caudoviricetes sp.]